MENWNLLIAFLSMGSKHDKNGQEVAPRSIATARPHNEMNVTCPN
jgi:hypothetical protein